jgi:hypothetical protein
MDFVIVVVISGLFSLGVVLMFQAFVGGEIRSEGAAFGQPHDLEHPGISHPPERHRWRLASIGLGLIAIAITLGIVAM